MKSVKNENYPINEKMHTIIIKFLIYAYLNQFFYNLRKNQIVCQNQIRHWLPSWIVKQTQTVKRLTFCLRTRKYLKKMKTTQINARELCFFLKISTKKDRLACINQSLNYIYSQITCGNRGGNELWVVLLFSEQ